VYKRLDEVFTDTMIDQAKTVFTESMLKEYHGPIAELFKKKLLILILKR
jgi:hypothetical protein